MGQLVDRAQVVLTNHEQAPADQRLQGQPSVVILVHQLLERETGAGVIDGHESKQQLTGRDTLLGQQRCH